MAYPGKAYKIIDVDPVPGGRAGRTNARFAQDVEDYIKYFKPLRTPSTYVKSILSGSTIIDLDRAIYSRYKIRSMEYGNWVNQFRRIDFDLNFIIAMEDFNKVLKFKDNIGVNRTLNVAYGARGMSSAYAHYEPGSKVINLTRDRRVDKITDMFGNPVANFARDKAGYRAWQDLARKDYSGYGSFAHEYGHFLDYILAEKYVSGRNKALSGGSVPIYSPNNPFHAYEHFYDAVNAGKSEIEEAVLFILTDILFKLPPSGKISVTPYYKRLYEYARAKGDYWLRLNEIWARFFEIFTAYKLHKLGIENLFLVRDKKGKYYHDPDVKPQAIYLTYNEMDKLYKKGDKFLKIANTLINKYWQRKKHKHRPNN